MGAYAYPARPAIVHDGTSLDHIFMQQFLIVVKFLVLPGSAMYVLLCLFGTICHTNHAWHTSSGMVYKDAEKLYGEVRTDAEGLIDNALRVLYPGSLPLSSAASAPPPSGPLTIFAHNTTFFARRDIVRVPLGKGGIDPASVLQTTGDGKEGYVILEGGAGGGLVLPSQISAKDLDGAQTQTSRSCYPLPSTTYASDCLIDVTVNSANGDSFVLGNRAVQLKVVGGRITSVFDVRLKCVLFPFPYF